MNSINDYILKLDKLSKYFQNGDSLEQKELYNSILNELRELYRRQPKDFTDQNIVDINKLKIIIKNRGSRYIKNCYFKIENESDKISIYASTPIGEYSFFNNLLLNNKLENDEIEIKTNNKHEIEFIFDKIKRVYLYPSLNQKIIRYNEDKTYKFKHVYFNCQYNSIYTQSYNDIEAIRINFMDNQDFITFKRDDVYIKYNNEYYEDGLRAFKIIDKIGKYIFYLRVADEDLKDIFERNILKDYETNAFINHNYKYVIKEKLLKISKNEYQDDGLVEEIKEYIFYYLDEYLSGKSGISPDMPAEFKISYMYDCICSAIDEIIICKTEEVLNDNLKLIYNFMEDADFLLEFDENLIEYL